MNKDFKGVIFDLDGTLVDSMWMWNKIDKIYLKQFGITAPIDFQAQIEGMSFSETAHFFKQKFAIPDSIEKIKADWNNMARETYQNEVPLKEGVLPFLEFCKKNRIAMGIATSNSRELVDNILQIHQIASYFQCVTTSCDVGKGKPFPDVYLQAAKGIDVEPKDCLVFEDIVPGIMAGINAGMTVCAVEDEYSKHTREKKKQLAHYYINDFQEVFTLFEG